MSKQRKRLSILKASVFFIIAFLLALIIGIPQWNQSSTAPPYQFDYTWADENLLVAHAFGSIDGFTYTNSLDAFIENYAKGQRVFEVDFDLTEDYRMVAAHDETAWRNLSAPPPTLLTQQAVS